jgi:hypothetical protein
LRHVNFASCGFVRQRFIELDYAVIASALVFGSGLDYLVLFQACD